jgi:hypothetical protein
MLEMVVFVLKSKHESASLNLLQVPPVEKSCLPTIVEMFVYYSHQQSVRLLLKPWVHMSFESLIDHVVVLMLALLLGRICSFVHLHSLKSHLTSLHNADSSWCVYSLMALAFMALSNILASYLRLLGL